MKTAVLLYSARKDGKTASLVFVYGHIKLWGEGQVKLNSQLQRQWTEFQITFRWLSHANTLEGPALGKIGCGPALLKLPVVRYVNEGITLTYLATA